MSFDIAYDFRFDTNGFFDNPAARAALERAAEIWESLILDEFDDVAPGQSFSITNPSDATLRETVTLESPIDDLLIFVGAEELGGSTLGRGGYSGTDIGGDIFDARVSSDFRGTGPVTDFEPWVGVMRFDTSTEWGFSLGAPDPNRFDFISVALHEIGHVLGLGTAGIFEQFAEGGFDGPNAIAVNNGLAIPLEGDHYHVEEGFHGNSVLMDPTTTRGTRVLPSQVDLALLADIGYRVQGFVGLGETPEITTESDDVIVFGTDVSDVIDGLAGNDQIQGEGGPDTLFGGAGNDVLFGQDGNDRLEGGDGDDQLLGGEGKDTLVSSRGEDTLFGQDGADVFVIHSGGGQFTISDFDLVGGEEIHLIGSGYGSTEEVVEAISKPFSNVSRITFSDGTSLDVFHMSQSGTPLTINHFVLEETVMDVALFGQSGDDLLRGGDGNDTLSGFDGSDTLIGGAGHDVIEGGVSRNDLRDLVFGGAGHDHIFGGYGNDELRGDAGDDTISGGFGADTIIGGADNDALNGAALSDQIFGGDGDDFVNGGWGHDRVNGGAGADQFFHIGIVNHGSDWIQDYSAAEGDVLAFGLSDASRDQFQVNTGHRTGPDGARAGDDDIAEAFVIYRPTGQIMWALVDGMGQQQIVVQVGSQQFDLLM